MPRDNDLAFYLAPAEYIDNDAASVREKAAELTGKIADPAERTRVLYGAVRDGIRYDPYVDYTDPEIYRASSVLKAGAAYCVGKACSMSRCAEPPAYRRGSASPM